MGQEFYENISTSFRLCPPSHRPLRHLTNASAARFRVQPDRPTDRATDVLNGRLFSLCITRERHVHYNCSLGQSGRRPSEGGKKGRKEGGREAFFIYGLIMTHPLLSLSLSLSLSGERERERERAKVAPRISGKRRKRGTGFSLSLFHRENGPRPSLLTSARSRKELNDLEMNGPPDPIRSDPPSYYSHVFSVLNVEDKSLPLPTLD